MTISSTDRKAGPFAGDDSSTEFAFTFKVFSDADLYVVKQLASTGVETALTLTTDYTVALNSDQNAHPGGTVTLTSVLATGYNLTITTALSYLQPVDITNQGGFYPSVLNNVHDRQTIFAQQLDEHLSRSLKFPVSDSDTIDPTMPASAQRASTVMAFDDTGAPVVGPDVASVGTVLANIANVNTVATNIADVNTVATSISDVQITSANIADVNTVAGISADVSSVAAIDSNVTTVAAIDSNVTTVAGIAANVSSVAAIDTDVTTVAAIDSNVTTVAGIAADISAVAAIDSDVTVAATNMADITNFADVYYGPSAIDPTTRQDGSALQDGDLYWSTALHNMRVYNSSSTAWTNATSYVAPTIERFSGNDSDVDFIMAVTPGVAAALVVSISGVVQVPGVDYTVSGTTLAFTTAPPTGTNNIAVQYFGNAGYVTADYEVDALIAYGSSVNFTKATIDAALAAIGTTDKATLLLRPGTWAITDDLTITSNVTLKIPPGALLSISSGKTFTLNSQPEIGLYQVFSGSGTVAGLKSSNVLWFGANSDSGTTDNKTPFKQAFASVVVGGKVIIPYQTGYYKYDNTTGLTDAVAITQKTVVELEGNVRSTSSTNGANPPFIFNVTGAGTEFYGSGTLQGPGTFTVNEGTDTNLPGLLKINADDVKVTGINFIDPPEVGIFIYSCDDIIIDNIVMKGGPVVADATDTKMYYVKIRDGRNIKVLNSTFSMSDSLGSSRQGIDATGTTELHISGNHFYNIHEHSMYLLVYQSIISNNTIRHTQAAADQLGQALKVHGDGNIISNNKIYGAAKGGIISREGTNYTIVGNSIEGFGQDGIRIKNESAVAYGINNILIDGNNLVADTSGTFSIYLGVIIDFDNTVTADCKNIKVSNNTIYYAGATGSSQPAILVRHQHGTYKAKDISISNNHIMYPYEEAITLSGCNDILINGNLIKDPRNASRAIYFSTVDRGVISNNIIRDTNNPAKIDYMNFHVGTVSNLMFVNNTLSVTGTTARLNIYNSTDNRFGRGNRITEEASLFGNFTMNNVNTVTVNNANVNDGDLASVGESSVLIWPLNVYAATVMGSAKALYVSAKVAGTSFTVRTADGNAVAANNAIFGYEIIQ